MYQAVIEGKTVNLRNRDYERILDRLDASKLDENGKRKKQCSLCARFEDCRACPFGQFEKSEEKLYAGCQRLVNKFFRSKGLKSLFCMDYVSVFAKTTKQRERLQMLHDVFERSFRKVTK